jgi:hypothetical protein
VQIGKLGLTIIFLSFILLAIAAAAFAIPEFGQALHDFGANTLGPSMMGALTAVVCTPLAWGAETLLYGVVVWVAIAVTVSILWILIFKRAWEVAKNKLGYGQAKTLSPAPVPTMTTPKTVIVKETPVSTTEVKEEPVSE